MPRASSESNRYVRGPIAALCCGIALCSSAAAVKREPPRDPLEPARAALRTLHFDQAIALLKSAGNGGNADAQYLLGLMYLNGVGIAADSARGRTLLQNAAERGQGAAAYVLAGELAHDPDSSPDASRQWLERSAKIGYYRAVDALKSGRPLLDRESVGASDPTLLTPWAIDCARRNDAAEIRRLGPMSATVRDEFGRTALSHAAAVGSLAAAAALLDLGADVRAVDEAGTTALMLAAEHPEDAMIALLLQHGADPQAVDAEQRSVLFYAARANRPRNVDALQHAGATLDAKDSRGYNALDAALVVGADEAAAELRSLGMRANRVTVDPGRQSSKFDPAHPGEIYRGWPPLALAVARNDTSTVQQMLHSPEDANLRLPRGDSLLQVAADAHALQSLPLLLAHGANATATGSADHSVLWLAAARNDIALVKALLSAGVSPDAHAAGESTPLLAALGAKRPEVAEALLVAGAGVESADAQGRTPLILASAGGEAELVKRLIERHARTDAVDQRGRSALYYAAAFGSRDAVVMLLAAGANPKSSDAGGLTALHAGAAQPNAEVLAPLLALDLSVNRRDDAGETPLIIAAATGHADVVRALLARTPELNLQDKAGDTALIAASRGGFLDICHLLLTAGANTSLRNGAGISASDIAVGRGFASIAKELAGKS